MLPTERFLTFIQQQQLYNTDKKVLLAVSGGRDSVLMVKLFNAASLSFGIAHCNFGLRGSESEGDEVFVRELALEMGVSFFSVRFDTQKYATDRKVSIQMAARDLRYHWLEKIREENDFEAIALAHHASDVTETILLNLTRGTGIAGMHGIKVKRNNLIRPMLFLKREEVDEIVGSETIVYREDSSNLSAKYARNKIRLEVIPKLKELNPALDETFEKNSRRFGQLEEFLNIQVSGLRNGLFKKLPEGLIEIELQKLKELQPLELLLFELFKPFNFSEAVLADLVGTWRGEPGKVYESTSHLIVLDRNKLILEERLCKESEEVIWHCDRRQLEYLGRQYTSETVGSENLSIERSREKAFFDENLLQYPLKLRLWEEGDYFYPFGMKGKKKLSDYLREMKVPLTQKGKIPLLVNGNGDILWVIGYRTDERYKVGPQTKKISIFKQI
ncbi:tRNA lysidine(34) synthetase TilS [Desertivirga arenae]|uniref:tRNA lysidine(34) synthetase TilS n=1 Tax=Desertivirga arenae TaxID=2810309 RepID=UPI001A96A454|nr:tRNA lysidine(34) synthetase TilS [Pedobacter sp. SYSU D00823]